MDPTTKDNRGFTIAFYATQFFYGGWFLFHGLNWWLHFFPERSFAPDARGLIPELIRSGLFDVVKLLEVVIGLALLADLFVPLAIVAAFPLTFVIAYLNFSHHSVFGTCVGIVIVALNALMAIGHLDRYLPMLAMRAGAPTPAGLRALTSRGTTGPLRSDTLSLRVHVLAIGLGVATPALLTYASIYFAKPPATVQRG